MDPLSFLAAARLSAQAQLHTPLNTYLCSTTTFGKMGEQMKPSPKRLLNPGYWQL